MLYFGFAYSRVANDMPLQSIRGIATTRLVVIETDLDTVVLWEKAQALDPSQLRYARFVRGTTTPDGLIEATVEVEAGHYDYLVAALGIELVASALEAELTHDAAEVVEPVELEEELAKIPVANGTTFFGPDTFAVSWSVADAVYVWQEIATSDTELRDADMVRTGRGGDTVLLAVTLPTAVVDKVRAAYRELEEEDEDADPVLEIMRSILWPADETWRRDGRTTSADDGEIPF